MAKDYSNGNASNGNGGLVALAGMQSYHIKSLRQVGDSDSRLFGN